MGKYVIDSMLNDKFEQYLASLFTYLGYETKSIPDKYGADLIATKGSTKIAIQAKCDNEQIEMTAVQDAITAKDYYAATLGMVITNSYFSIDAVSHASYNNIELWDRDKLIENIINAFALENAEIEVQTHQYTPLLLNDCLLSNEYASLEGHNIVFGKDNNNEIFYGNLKDICHLLITGKSLSGKSNFLHCCIVSLLQSNPDNINFLIIDSEILEFSIYRNMNQLLVPIITAPYKASGALSWAVNEVLNRYKILANNHVKNLDSYNQKCINLDKPPLPHVVIVIDEIFNLDISPSNDVYNAISQITLQGHRVGIHLLVSTKYENTEKTLRKLFPSIVQLFQEDDIRYLTYTTPNFKCLKTLASPYIPWDNIEAKISNINNGEK